MIRYIQKKIEEQLQAALKREFGLVNYAIPEAAYPEPQLGDLSYTLAFPLAKELRKSPKSIAEQIAANFTLDQLPEVEKVEVGGNGYLNLRLHRAAIARELHASPLKADSPGQVRVIVEHTNINPNKAAHVGHLRNACLGDTLVKLLDFSGRNVEVQNYIDDTGVQLADVVVGFQRAGKTLEDLDRISGSIDSYFWDLYAEIHEWLEQAPENKQNRERVLHEMEQRMEPTFSLSQEIADRVIRCHLKTMGRLGIQYQLLPRESDIIGLRFWQRTFDLLQQKGAITKVEEGKNQGCWVMRLTGHEDFEDMQNPDKIIVRSNGTVTYVGKDIAYQLWKFGLLGVDFHYRPFATNPDGSTVWSTSSRRDHSTSVRFGSADAVYNVIDQRQSYLQKVVAEGLRALGYNEQADRSVHFAYEMVTLSPRTAIELGFHLSQSEKGKSFVEMSGRKGIGVKADDLLDRLEKNALTRIRPLYPDLEEKQVISLASDIAAGALRYFMIRYTRNTIITFDMDEALSFEGETGPYLQYSLVRARSIIRKLRDSGFEPDAQDNYQYTDALQLLGENTQEADDSWNIILELIKMKDIANKALRSLEISYFAKYVFQLAQLFNNYYHKYPVLHESDERRKMLRIAIVRMFIRGMETNQRLLGIPVPEKM